MGGKYLIVSDLHLTDIEEHADGWKKYKSAMYSIAEPFQSLLKEYETEDDLTLVLNGDVIDFDLVVSYPEDSSFKITRGEKKRGMLPTEEKSLWKLEQVMKAQEAYFDVLSDFLIKGRKLIYVIGNHDREFHFEQLQTFFKAFLLDLAEKKGKQFSLEHIQFYPWFYYEENGVYIEHGNQYDYYTSFKFPLKPTVLHKGEEEIALPMGNLSNRYLMTSMGFFNPHATDYILSGMAYLKHWLTKYAFSRRSLVLNWIFGSLLVMFKLFSLKSLQKKAPDGYEDLLNGEAKRLKLRREVIDALNQLRQMPIMYRTFRVIKEFWLDRVFLSLLLTGGTIALALVPIPLWIKLMVPLSSFPLLFFIYERLTKGESIFTIEEKIPNYAKKIANILPAKAIVFGHSHHPRSFPINKTTYFMDSGTWAPVYDGKTPELLKNGLRNYIFIDLKRERFELKSFLNANESLNEK